MIFLAAPRSEEAGKAKEVSRYMLAGRLLLQQYVCCSAFSRSRYSHRWAIHCYPQYDDNWIDTDSDIGTGLADHAVCQQPDQTDE